MTKNESLSDGVVTIRPHHKHDILPLFDAVTESIQHALPYLMWCKPNYTVRDSKAWVQTRQKMWETGREYSFVIADAQDGYFLGGVSLDAVDGINRCADLGYWVRLSAIKKGVATRAARLVLRFGFDILNLHRVQIITADTNLASQKVAEKLGTVREGIFTWQAYVARTTSRCNIVFYSCK